MCLCKVRLLSLFLPAIVKQQLDCGGLKNTTLTLFLLGFSLLPIEYFLIDCYISLILFNIDNVNNKK